MRKLKNLVALCTALSLVAGCGVSVAEQQETSDESEQESVQENPARAQDDF